MLKYSKVSMQCCLAPDFCLHFSQDSISTALEGPILFAKHCIHWVTDTHIQTRLKINIFLSCMIASDSFIILDCTILLITHPYTPVYGMKYILRFEH